MGNIKTIGMFNRNIQPMLKENVSEKVLQETNLQEKIFSGILGDKLKEVKFSQHAVNRLNERNIKINDSEKQKLQEAVDKAEEKGSKEALVLLNKEVALVVSIKNRTVITAMDGQSIKDNVFTNIDSAVII